MIIVPLKALPSQTVGVVLGQQACTINVYQKFYGVYVDLLVNDVLIIGGVVARDRNRIVRSVYLGFDGDLTFFDMQGGHDPDYTGLGSQFLLAYLSADEIAALAPV